jgi:hypothetical protein
LGVEQTAATQYASEGLDAVRSIKNRGFANLSAVNATGRSVILSGGVWTFGADNTTNTLTHSTTDNYIRQVKVEPVNRSLASPNGNIVASGGVLDPLTKKVTATVTWQFTTARPQTVTLISYMSDWGATIAPTAIPPTTVPTVVPTATPTPPAWPFRKKITINQSQITGSSSLTNFPVMISITDAQLAANAQTTGNDIKFTAADGTTKLDHEIELYTSGTGKLIAWVQVPSVSATVNTDIYMYYGNATATNQQNVTGTWDANYKGVWHLKESSGSRLDSTSNLNNMTDVGGVSGATGKIGNANGFVRANSEFLNLPDTASTKITGALTLEAWVNSNDIADGSNNVILAKDGGSNISDGYKLNAPSSNGQFRLWSSTQVGSTTNGGTNLSSNTWYFLTATYDLTTQRIYLNGALDGSVANTSTTYNNTSPLRIGARGSTAGGSNWWDGEIDEVRLSNIARSADWLMAEYNNINTPGTFSTLGGQEVL